MFDIIGSLVLSAIAVIDVAVLVGFAHVTLPTKAIAYVVAAAWFIMIVAITAVGGFAPGAIGPLPGPVLPFAILVIGGLVAWFAWPEFHKKMLSIPLAALLGVNIFRIGGVFFLMLMTQGRLAAPFAPSAGWGDIITGLAAIPLAWMAARGRAPSKGVLIAWNTFGTLDLFAAIAFGVLSAGGTPFQIFTDEPGTAAMGTLPWISVPAFLVPLYLLTHLAIFAQLRSHATHGDAGADMHRRPVRA